MEELQKLTVKQLRELLKERGLSVRYNLKSDLANRLYPVLLKESGDNHNIVLEVVNSSLFQTQQVEGEEEGGHFEEGGDEEEYFETGSEDLERTIGDSERIEPTANNSTNLFKSEEKFKEVPAMNFAFRDVEESLETFSGESGRNCEDWLQEFEEIANACNWNDVHKYLYARRLLRGAAKLAIEATTGIYNWKSLKEILQSDFKNKPTSMEVHKMLESRKKKYSESLLEYLYEMKQISNKGHVDEESLVSYIIQGIPDTTLNKTILYEARNLNTLKEKFKVYENMQKSRNENRQHNQPNQQSPVSRKQSNIAQS